MISDYPLVIFSEAVNINPKRMLNKGTITKAVSMSDIFKRNKKIQNYILKKYKGGSRFMNGDTLFARITPCLENGKTAYVDILNDSEVGFGSTEFIVFSEKPGISDANYIYYLSISDFIRDPAIKSMTGTSGRQRVDSSIFHQIKVPLPDLELQKKISQYLSNIDDKINVNAFVNIQLEKIGESLFKRWFFEYAFPDESGTSYRSNGGAMKESPVGEIPEDWTIKTLDYFGDIAGGSTPSTKKLEYWGGDIPWITPKDLSNFSVGQIFIKEGERNITKKAKEECSLRVFPKGSVLLSSRAPIGYLAIADADLTCNQGFKNIIPNNNDYSEFLYYLLKANIERFKSVAGGSTFREISGKVLKEIEVVIPSDSIISKFHQILSPIFEMINTNSRMNVILSKLRDALLPRLLSGEIRVSLEGD